MAAEGPEAPASPGRGGAEGALGDGGDGATGPPAPELPLPAPNPPPEEPSDATAPPQAAPPSCNGATVAAAPPEPQEPPPAVEPPQEPPPMPAEEPPPTYPMDFEKFWLAAQSNPHDFTAWTELLQFVEQENHLLAARKAFDAFFSHYPYCYGYWKKYADMERRFECARETEEVFERGLQSIPLSMDLWIHYISYLQSTLDMSLPESIQKIRGVFEAAVAAAGMDFRSDKLWELYVEWEREQGDLRAVTGIYDRVLSMPTQLYNHHWEKFKEHVLHNPPKDILSPEELLWVQSKLATDPVPKPPEPEGTEVPPGEDLPPGVEGKGAAAANAQEDLDQEKIRELVISMRQQIYAQNEAEVSKRWNFEDGIKRPYFHVKPLERAQLRNWRDYLDYEMAAGSHERTIVLFERCVIACALYEEFWIKYTKYLENHTVTGARSVFQRACGYHLPRKPNIHLLWAAFEEKQGNVEEARRILRCFEEAVPGLAMVRLRRVSLERRHGQLERAEALLTEAMEANAGLPLASFYAVKLARQACKVQQNLAKARRVLVEALEKEPDNARLHANLLEMEFGADVGQNEGNTMRCFERALRSPLPDEAKLIFSQRRVEFLEDFGSSIHSLLTAYDEHQKILKQHAARKRAPENGSEEPEDKRLRPDDGSGMGGGPVGFSSVGGDNTSSPSYNYWYQHGYGSYSYQSPWNYNQYYPQT
ncbi:pre-mRNA-processing factor 39-like isoform X1 [Neopsephotus bourkii]|uniref:pre-mRNA-processing factor 39-like isoform X1 n=1 Tax=Neopsephotus bourkii TaxID=309878 RepID=UPI002AA517D1|nr:pre-mRNA-processing factor 39-like isoform X1 [Neopsephotus bourkii]